MSDDTEKRFNRFKVYAGIALFMALVAIHVLVKDLHVAVICLPGVLFGVDLSAILPGGKK